MKVFIFYKIIMLIVIVLLIFRTRIIERTEGNGKEDTRPRSM